MYVNLDLDIGFVHIPKTGGSSITSALIEASTGSVPDPIHGWQQKHHKGGLHGGLISLDTRPSFVFTIVRNPYERFVSYYKALCCAKENTSVGAAKAAKISFEDYFIYLHKIAPSKHWRRQQVTYCESESGDTVDRVFFYEEYEKMIEELENRLQRSLSVPRINQGAPRKHYREFYDTRTKNMATELCLDDLRVFNYEF